MAARCTRVASRPKSKKNMLETVASRRTGGSRPPRHPLQRVITRPKPSRQLEFDRETAFCCMVVSAPHEQRAL